MCLYKTFTFSSLLSKLIEKNLRSIIFQQFFVETFKFLPDVYQNLLNFPPDLGLQQILVTCSFFQQNSLARFANKY